MSVTQNRPFQPIDILLADDDHIDVRSIRRVLKTGC